MIWPFKRRPSCLQRIEQANYQLQDAIERLAKSTAEFIALGQPSKVQPIRLEKHADRLIIRRGQHEAN